MTLRIELYQKYGQSISELLYIGKHLNKYIPNTYYSVFKLRKPRSATISTSSENRGISK